MTLCQSPAMEILLNPQAWFRITKDLEDSIEGKHVLIVEDIIDTGLTLSYLLKNLWSRNRHRSEYAFG